MDVVWEELNVRASEFTLRGDLRQRDVACILKLKYYLRGEIALVHVLMATTSRKQVIPPDAAHHE